ncbi:MAG: glycosyltransferase family 2 protein [Candidatus Thorarchaeota archaeon]
MNLKNSPIQKNLDENPILYSKQVENQIELYPKATYPSISIIIPIYNEENTIRSVLKMIPSIPKSEIILIDDGSIDKSLNIIKAIKNKHIKIIKHKRNMGYGAAILTGFKYSSGDLIITLDSDGQHNPKEIFKLINPIIEKEADVVIGSRYLGKCNYNPSLYTKIGELFIKMILWILYRQIIHNNQSGFRAFNNKAINEINKIKCNGMGFTTELLMKLYSKKLNVKEIPIAVKSRSYGDSKVNIFRTTPTILKCILKYLYQKLKNPI